jgi:endonuclease-3
MTKAEKKNRIQRVIDILKEVYPEATCALEYGGDPWRLLVMGRLSAQCTDARVNIVCRELFRKFSDAKSMADAEVLEIEEIIKPCGLYKSKAKNLKDASAMLISEFDGELPRDMDSLLRLPGVGRKIANLLLGDVFGLPAIVCDTHCMRICGRLGMYPESLRDPNKIEKILKELIPGEEGSDFCHRIVYFGRDVCNARNPKCADCPLKENCSHGGGYGKNKA